jgi:hypothetical protein
VPLSTPLFLVRRRKYVVPSPHVSTWISYSFIESQRRRPSPLKKPPPRHQQDPEGAPRRGGRAHASSGTRMGDLNPLWGRCLVAAGGARALDLNCLLATWCLRLSAPHRARRAAWFSGRHYHNPRVRELRRVCPGSTCRLPATSRPAGHIYIFVVCLVCVLGCSE